MPATAVKKKQNLGVRIAKDVLKHLAKTKVRAGSYISNPDGGSVRTAALGNNWVGETPQAVNSNAQEYLPAIQKKCAVCALGACMLSYVRLEDKVTVNELYSASYNRDEITQRLKKGFTDHDMDAIEIAFEAKNEVESLRAWERLPHQTAIAARKFGKRFASDRSRLKAIMKNVVKNKGKFIP